MILSTIHPSSRRRLCDWALPPLLGATVFMVAVAAILLTRDSGRIAAIWPSDALIAAVLLCRRRSEWPALILGGLAGNIAANAVGGDPPATAVLMACANVEVQNVRFWTEPVAR